MSAACAYCAGGHRHPQFVSLLVDGRLSPQQLASEDASVHVDYSRQPMANLACHQRRRRYRPGPKTTKALAPHIVHAVIVGPFFGAAALFARVLKARCRRWPQSIRGAVRLARRWHELDHARQAGARVRVWAADQHVAEMERVVAHVWQGEGEADNKQQQQLEQAARVLIAAAAAAAAKPALVHAS